MKTYKINEIFYTLQGEGFYTGTPSLFIRFSGCNLQCPFCDTSHQSFHETTLDEIIQIATQSPIRHVVLTGGEPALQIDEPLTTALHHAHKFIAIETNGTTPIQGNVDWITLSPKTTWSPRPLVIRNCNELKVVFTNKDQDFSQYLNLTCQIRYLQPCDTHDKIQNKRILQEAIEYCLENPQWNLSLQTQKLIGIR